MRPLLRVLKENNGYHFAKGGTRALRWKTGEGTMVGLRWWWWWCATRKASYRPSYVAEPTKFFTSAAMAHVYEKRRNFSGLRASSLFALPVRRYTPSAPCLHSFTRDLFVSRVHVPLILPPSRVIPRHLSGISLFLLSSNADTTLLRRPNLISRSISRMNKISKRPSLPSFLVTKSPDRR